MKLTNNSVRFVCTDEGRHAEVTLGTYFSGYALGTPEATFVRSKKAGGEHLTGARLAMDEQCPRCRRHPKFSGKKLREVARHAAKLPYVEAGWFTVDVSLTGHC